MTTTVLYTDETTRKCGDCQLCCKLLPTSELNKPANTKCIHQKFKKGCAIYSNRPLSCQAWSCRWLMSLDTADMPRPDRSHYVIDLIPDFVRVKDNATGELVSNIEVVQVWLDPDFPDAHHDPWLRLYLFRRGEEGIAALIRYGSKDGFVLFPPQLTEEGLWREERGGNIRDEEHSLEEFIAAGEENKRLAAEREAKK